MFENPVPWIVVGSTQSFTAIGKFNNGTTQDLTATATWTSAKTSVATMSGNVATAVATGVLRREEADYALRTVHRTLDEVTRHRDLNQWLAYRGIFDVW